MPPTVHKHLAQGNKLRAIAAYQKATGADLRSAKEAVEAYDSRR